MVCCEDEETAFNMMDRAGIFNAIYVAIPAALPLFDLLHAESAELIMPTTGHDFECIHNGVGARMGCAFGSLGYALGQAHQLKEHASAAHPGAISLQSSTTTRTWMFRSAVLGCMSHGNGAYARGAAGSTPGSPRRSRPTTATTSFWRPALTL